MRYIVLLFCLVSVCQPILAQDCDTTLSPLADREYGYRERGNRCEGFYKSPVAVPTLDVIGVLQGKFNFDLDNAETITLYSPNVNDTIFVRAQAAPTNTYYRMDAQLNPGQKLVWPVNDVLLKRRLSRKKISVMGWYTHDDSKIHVPLKAEAKLNNIINDDKVRVILRSTIDIKIIEFQWRLLVDSKPYDWQILKRPALAGNKIIIPAPDAAHGLYYLWVCGYENNFDEEPISERLLIMIGKP